MWWATAPKATNRFTVTATATPAQESPSKQLTEYTPEGLVYIHVNANEEDLKYRGLLLYGESEEPITHPAPTMTARHPESPPI